MKNERKIFSRFCFRFINTFETDSHFLDQLCKLEITFMDWKDVKNRFQFLALCGVPFLVDMRNEKRK